MDSIPTELLELQTRFETWRANRRYIREPIPEKLRNAALEMTRRYPPSIIHRVLKIDPSRLKNKPVAKLPAPTTSAPKKKQAAKHHSQTAVTKSPPPAFFKLPEVAALPVDSSSLPSLAPCRLQLERPDGSPLTLILPALDASAINLLCADFLRAGKP
jgi:hypothetical protein